MRGNLLIVGAADQAAGGGRNFSAAVHNHHVVKALKNAESSDTIGDKNFLLFPFVSFPVAMSLSKRGERGKGRKPGGAMGEYGGVLS